MCYCGTVEKDGFYQCCQDQITMNQESRYFGGQMSKAEMVRWDMERDKTPEEITAAKKKVAEFMEKAKKGEKNNVASAYMPKVEKAVKAALNTVPPNETPREELLQRDVGILFKENRELKAENARIMEINRILIEQNISLLKVAGKNANV